MRLSRLLSVRPSTLAAFALAAGALVTGACSEERHRPASASGAKTRGNGGSSARLRRKQRSSGSGSGSSSGSPGLGTVGPVGDGEGRLGRGRHHGREDDDLRPHRHRALLDGPATKAVTDIGAFSGLGGGSTDDSVTDLAVNAAGDVFVNSESVIYTAALPAGGKGSVALTKVAPIALQSGQRFVALAFTPADALGKGTGEVLIGGDGNGELWSIDPSSGATKDLGNFGADPNSASATLALSGDVVFYIDSTGAPKGLATIRSCTTSSMGSTSCTGSSDYLAGIDMTALASAYANGTHTTSLNAGIYGSPSPSQAGPGTGYPDVFGLGVWGGSVYGFTHGTTGTPSTQASLLSIATSGSSAGVGTIVPTSVSLGSGWAGAGVTTKVTVTVAAPPPPPTPK